MSQSRNTGYGVGSAKANLAPVPFETNDTLGTSDFNFNLGQIAYEVANARWVIYSGNATWVPFAGATGSILTINNIAPTILGNFTLTAGSGISLTAGTNEITIALTGGATAIDTVATDSGSAIPDGTGLINLKGQATPGITGLSFSASGSTITGTMLSPFEGDFAFTQSSAASATNRKLIISNADTTNSASNSQVVMSVGGTSSGDPFNLYAIASNRSWAWGPDVSDSNTFKLTTTAGTTASPRTASPIWKATTAGIITTALQPFVIATHTVVQNNVTGNGTVATVNFTTIVANVQSGYDGTNTFTVPAGGAGTYLFICGLLVDGLDATSTGGYISIVTTSATYSSNSSNWGNMRRGPAVTNPNQVALTQSCIGSMSVGDTAKVQFAIEGMAGDSVDVPANGSGTYFMIYKIG